MLDMRYIIYKVERINIWTCEVLEEVDRWLTTPLLTLREENMVELLKVFLLGTSTLEHVLLESMYDLKVIIKTNKYFYIENVNFQTAFNNRCIPNFNPT